MKHRLYQVLCLALITLFVVSAVPINQKGIAQSDTSLYLPLLGNSGNPPPPSSYWSDAQKAAIHSIVYNAGTLGKLAENDPGNPTTTTITQTINGEDYWVGVESNHVVKNKSELLNLGMNDHLLWPGALIEGDQAHDFVYTPITLPRAPMVLSVNLENVSCAGNLQQTVVDPNLANVREGIRNLLQVARQGCSIIPAQAQFTHEQVYDESSLNVALGAKVNTSVVDLSGKLDFNNLTKKNKIITTYQQIFYEININTPVTQADFFDPTRNTVAGIATQLPPGSRPMYVAGVKYGMMALMFFESNFSEETVKAAVELSYQRGLTATITSTLTAKNVLDKSIINIVVYGGSTAGLQSLYSGTQGFEDVIKASAEGGPNAPGVPILYKFRHFLDNNLALITFTSDYSFAKNLFPMEPRIGIVLDKFEIVRGYPEDPWPVQTVYEMTNMILTVSAKNRTSFADPGTAIAIDPYQRGCWHSGCIVNVPRDPPDNYWPTAPMTPVYIFYDNRHQPFDWRYATLKVKGQVDQIDVWPDPWDHGESTQDWISGDDILGGQWLYDTSVTPYKPYTFDFAVSDWIGWKMDVRAHIRIYFYNQNP